MEVADGKIVLILIALLLITSCTGCINFLTQSEELILRLRKSETCVGKKSDILFLLETSSKLSGNDFNEEKAFVTRLLNKIAVSYEATRVQVIPFGAHAQSYIDFISKPAISKNKCAFNEKFKGLAHQGGSLVAMKEAFDEAWAVCFGSKSGHKRRPAKRFKTVVILLTTGMWNHPWQNPDPRPRAKQLREAGVEILAVGVGPNVDLFRLMSLVDDPVKQVFRLAHFDRYTELAAYIRGGKCHSALLRFIRSHFRLLLSFVPISMTFIVAAPCLLLRKYVP